MVASSLQVPPELVPGRDPFGAKPSPTILPPTEIVSGGSNGHERRRDPASYSPGYPGARAFHSSAILKRTDDNQHWVYTYGGLIPNTATLKVVYRADLWRYRAEVTGAITWQYVGCSTNGDYIAMESDIVVGSTVGIASFCPSARARASLVSVGEDLILSGGVGAHGALDDIWRFDTVQETWTLLAGHSLKLQPTITDAAIIPVFTGSVSARTMGSRYDHSCDVLPNSTKVYCFGGMTARGVYVDIYRSAAPITLSRPTHFATIANPTTLTYPLDSLGSNAAPSKVVSFLPRDLLRQAGLLPGMTLRNITFYLTRPADADVSVLIKLGVMSLNSSPNAKLNDYLPADNSTKEHTRADFGTSGTEFTLPLKSPITLTADSAGLIIALWSNAISKAGLGSGGRVEESLAYSSFAPGIPTNDVLTLYSGPRSKNTHFTTSAAGGELVYESSLVPQMRLHASPRGGGLTQGHASSSDMFVINTLTGQLTAMFAPPTGAAPSAAVLSKTLSVIVVSSAYASDPVIEDAELGYGAVWADAIVPDPGPSAPANYSLLPTTLPALASHTFALVNDPTAQYAMQGIPAFTLYGGRWVQETPYETMATDPVDQIAGFTTFRAATNAASPPQSRYDIRIITGCPLFLST